MRKTLLWALSVCIAQSLSAQTIEYQGLIYQINDSHNYTLTLAGAADPGNLTSVVLPETVPYEYRNADDGLLRVNCTVTHIGRDAFSNNESLKTVQLSSAVVSIADYAFQDCSSLESVKFSESLEYVGAYTFSNCSRLDGVKFPSKTKTIGPNSFGGCISLKNLELNEGLESMDRSAFAGTAIENLTIPSTVSFIGNMAFYRCDELQKVTFRGSVATIDYRAFDYSFKISEVHAPDINAWCNTHFVDGTSNPVCTAKKLYLGCRLAEDITIPGTVAEIPDFAFDCCHSLKNLKFEDGVKTVGHSSFKDCINLESVDFGTSVESIAFRAFAGDVKLTSVTFPSSLAVIGSYAFEGCTSLESLNWSDGITKVSEYAFNRCGNLKSVNIGDLSKWCRIKFDPNSNPLLIADKLLLNGEEIVDLTIPADVEHVADYAFNGGADFQSVTIPNTVRYIGNSSFSNCTLLKRVSIGNGLSELDLYSFGQSYGIETLRIEDGESPLSLAANTGWASGWAIPEILKEVYVGRPLTVDGTFAPRALTLTLGPTASSVDISFPNMKNLVQITALGDMPAQLSEFSDKQYSNLLVLVPAEVSYKYFTADIWRNFDYLTDDPANDFSNLSIRFDKEAYGVYPGSSYYTPGPLNYTITPEAFSWMPVTMTSSNTSYVSLNYKTIDGKKVYTANAGSKAGEADVTVSIDNTDVSATCHVTSYSAPTSVYFTEGSRYYMDGSATHQFEVNLRPMMIEPEMLSWTSSNPSVLTVDGKGFATAHADGEATLTVTTYNNRSANCLVTVKNYSGICPPEETAESSDVYTVGGLLLNSNATADELSRLPHGIYLVRSGNSVRKLAR